MNFKDIQRGLALRQSAFVLSLSGLGCVHASGATARMVEKSHVLVTVLPIAV